MKRIRNLGRFQKVILIVMGVMILGFAAAYAAFAARDGFEYRNQLLIPKQEEGRTVYSGKLNGEQIRFWVYGEGRIEFQYGDERRIYTIREAPDAVPEEEGLSSLTGIEVRRDEELLFRGGTIKEGGRFWLYHEDGSADIESYLGGTWGTTSGGMTEEAEPTVSDLLILADGPELTYKGDWIAWFSGTLICLLAAVSILFADELFRFGLRFYIQDAEAAEPSDWVIAGRYFLWTMLCIMAFVIFIIGLQ